MSNPPPPPQKWEFRILAFLDSASKVGRWATLLPPPLKKWRFQLMMGLRKFGILRKLLFDRGGQCLVHGVAEFHRILKATIIFSDINECNEVAGACGENTSCADLVGNPTHTCSCLPGSEQRSSGDAYTTGCAGKIWPEIENKMKS